MPNSLNALPVLCLTVGDPSGIGPEIAAKMLAYLAHQPDPGLCLRVFGDIRHLVQTAECLSIELPDDSRFDYEHIQPAAGLSQALQKAGSIAYRSLEVAVSQVHAGQAQGLITGPISKENLQRAELPFQGHTEILQHFARRLYGQPYQSDMLFVYREFRMLLLTRHVALRRVAEALTIRGVVQSLDNLVHFLQVQCQIKKPKLCLLGVNPHAGEMDGDEEQRILLPAIQLVEQKWLAEIESPKAADAVFRGFQIDQVAYDSYVAAYHDQGLIPFKMVAGLEAVNITIGLPFIRTSVSHGTAPDIVGLGIADPASLIAAYEQAVMLCLGKSKTDQAQAFSPSFACAV